MNIVSMGMKYLAPVVVAKIADKMGIRGPLANKLIMAALPTVLAMVAGKAKSGGAGGLLDMLRGQPQQDPDVFARSLESGDIGEISSAGGDLLGGLLGGSPMDQLNKALANYGGVSAQQGSALAGLMAPAALGALQSQAAEQNLDANGLASFLSDQAQNIGDAVPADFAQQVSGLGLLDAVPTARPTAAAAAPAPAAPAKSGGLLKWLLPLIVIAGLAWYFLSGNDAMDKAGEMMEGQGLSIDGTDIGGTFTTAVDGLKETVGGITDAASAEAAVPQLNDFNGTLDTLGGLKDKLPEAGQTAFGGIVGTAMEQLKPMIEGAIETSGAGGILQPIADTMFEKLGGLAGN